MIKNFFSAKSALSERTNDDSAYGTLSSMSNKSQRPASASPASKSRKVIRTVCEFKLLIKLRRRKYFSYTFSVRNR